jgi:hypothetical protein
MRKLIGVALACLTALGAERFYDPNATGGNDGLTLTDAYTDWETARLSVQNGDTLWVMGRDQVLTNYIRFLNKDSITVKIHPDSTGRITWQAANCELYNVDNSLIDGWLNSTNYFHITGQDAVYPTDAILFRLRLCYNTTVRGFELEREDWYEADAADLAQVVGVSIGNSSGANDLITIEHNYIHHLSSDCINIANSGPTVSSNRYIIRSNKLSHSGDDGVQAAGGVSMYGNVVERNFAALLGGHQDGIQIAPGSKHHWIYGNSFKDFPQGIFVEYSGGYTHIFNNQLSATNRTTGGSVKGMSVSAAGPDYRNPLTQANFTITYEGEWVLWGNTFVGFYDAATINGGGSIVRYVSGTNFIWGGCIFVNCKTLTSNGDPTILWDASNFYWDTPGVQYTDASGNPTSIPSNRSAGNAVYADPLMIDLGGGNYRLQTNSPAINATFFKRELLTNYFTTDFDGTLRTNWTSGAFEITGAETVPDVPTGLTATAISTTEINVTWADVGTENGYKLERKTGGGGTYAQIATPAQNATSYADSGLTQETTYFYRIRATNLGGDSGYSSEANATTLAPSDPPPPASGVTTIGGKPGRRTRR